MKLHPDCDFCAAAAPRWLYPVKAGQRPMPPGFESGADDGWLACGTCGALIDEADRAGLLARAYAELVPRLPVTEGATLSRKMRRAAERDVVKAHSHFWRALGGSPRPV